MGDAVQTQEGTGPDRRTAPHQPARLIDTGIHHATNSEITLTGADEAIGKWSLNFHSIILALRTVTHMGVEYEDRYVRRDGR